jgi:siderophore synthetase component
MLSGAQQTSAEEALKAVQENVRRALLSCYAYEGFYPDSIDYLEEHYKLVINKDKYFVHYRIIANNLFPEVIVVEMGAQTE